MPETPSDSFLPRSIQVIDEAIRSCHDKDEYLVLLAKRAVNLASHSYISEAKKISGDLRKKNTSYDPRLTGWINFAEGLTEHFETLDNEKVKYKLTRGLLFGQIGSDRELASACSAWVAHCEFVDGRIERAAEGLVRAFQWSNSEDHEARGRASMLLADAFNSIDDIATSRYWFRLARNHASQSGNIAMQNVTLFNIAAYSVSRLTLDDCTSGAEAPDLKRTELEVSSASNLNSALSIHALPTLVPAMQAELQIVKRRWKEAASIIEDDSYNILTSSPRRLIPKFYAQRAWCRANMGDFSSAAADFSHSLRNSIECSDDDDRAVLHFRLAGVAKLSGISDACAENMSAASFHLSRFRQQQARIRAMLDSVLERISNTIKNPA